MSLLASLALSCRLAGIAEPESQLAGDSGVGPGEASPQPTPLRIEDLAKATVQVFALVREGNDWLPIWSGSGSTVDPAGLILTNFHVIDRSIFDYDAIAIAITQTSDQPAEPLYLAEVLASDASLDIAVLQVVSDLQGSAVSLDLPSVSLGDSDLVEIGDRLRILGYPGIGGETITFTEGAVSGFTLERGISGRAWIKTDATIAGGNSGGLGANARGELIGIPTIVTSGSEAGQSVDCRPLADTNRDGHIDGNDACVPVGGFINALRPINLAVPLIEAAREGRAYIPESQQQGAPSSGGDIANAEFFNLVFSDGVTAADQPTQLWHALPESPKRVCAFWDYAGMVDGVSWSSHWFVDGEVEEGSSIAGQRWGGGESGNWWVCLSNDRGLPDAVYEIAIEVEGKVLVTDSVYVGGTRSAATLTISNGSLLTVCEVNLSASAALNWGQNELSTDAAVAPGEIGQIELATGVYDLRLLDCEGEVIHEDYGLKINEDFEFEVGD